MMAVEPPLGHPNDPVISRGESRDSVDEELDRVLHDKQVRVGDQEGSEETRDYRGTDLPVRSHTPNHQLEASSEEDQSQYEDDYGPTEHQQTAMTELQQLKLELGYIEDEPPVYDVADRLKQLNQELAEDPTPIDGDRERSIKFKDDLVDLVAPPPDYEAYDSEDDTPRSVQSQEQQMDKKEDEESTVASTDRVTDKQEEDQNDFDSTPLKNPEEPSEETSVKLNDDAPDDIQLHKMSLNGSQDNEDEDDQDNRRSSDSEGFGDIEPDGDGDSRVPSATESINGTQNSHSDYGSDTEDPDPPKDDTIKSAKKTDEEKVLVEINGKFELLSREELKARGDAHLSPPDDSSPRSDSSTSIGSFQPTPPRDPRPKTAAEGARRKTSNVPPRRAHSANPARNQVNHGSGLEDFTYSSPYALSPAQKKYLRYRQKQEQDRQREERERQKEEEEKKKSANNEIFEAWLSNKRRQMGRGRQEKGKHHKEKEEQEEQAKKESFDDASFTSGSLNEREKQEAFDAWVRTKQDQKKKEKFIRDHEQREIDEGWYSHSKEENDTAFRRWLRKKNAERRKTGKDDYQKVRMQKLQERRTRKAMALVRAIKQSQSFKYVDYYGYRN